MSTSAANAPPPMATNGVITAPPQGVVGGNRKKQKRRAKAAAKSATHLDIPHSHAQGQPAELRYHEDALGYEPNDEYNTSDQENGDDYDPDGFLDDPDAYEDRMYPNGVAPPPTTSNARKNKKKKKSGSVQSPPGAYPPHMPPSLHHPHHSPPSSMMRAPPHRGHSHDGNIWNTSTQQERQNIKEFWLSLSEDDRKALLKIEKEAVLKKMKQQQKHSCSCTVCGRKRTAIEEELEVLYEGYYEELEQYAHHDQPPLPSTDGMLPDPLHQRRPHPLATPPPPLHPHPHHRTSHVHEHLDEDEYSDEEDEDYSDDDEDEDGDEEDDEEYSDDEPELEPERPRGHPGVPDFFNFGAHLTVKDNLLTVADDLLKNDGRKFIEMMEQLAERRMQRENRSQYEAEAHSGYPPNDSAYDHEDPLAAGDEFDDDEASYDSQEDYEDDLEEEDEMVGDIELASHTYNRTDRDLQGGLTEEQRMQEGRRMFQIFAARMFEQRVLTAYREKVAAERQAKLLEELADEDKLQAQREAKKQRDAQKKKDKKKQQQLAKAEEKAKRDAEKAAEEARVREAEEKKMEEQRRKKEEQRKKREEDKKRLEEEKARKESERLRRQQDEQQRREEAERKSREAKAAEKARKEEQRKRERDEREAREKEARERKAQEDKEKRERDSHARADKDAKGRERNAPHASHPPATAQPPQLAKRASQPGMIAVPGMYAKQTPSGISSPHPSIATPAIPKAPTPSKQRQASQQGSHASSPKQSHSQLSSAPSKSSSPGSTGPQQFPQQPKHIMQKPGGQQAGQHNPHSIQSPSPLNQHSVQPPPGMHQPQNSQSGFGGMPPMAYQGFAGPHGPMMNRGPMPGMFPNNGPTLGFPNRMGFGPPGMNGMAPPPGMMMPQGRGFPFDGGPSGMGNPPPGFGQMGPQLPNQTSPIGQTSTNEPQRGSVSGHSRQPSLEKERFETAANQPIARPAPIQRPSSVKPGASNGELEDLSKHLGSSALLDDSDEPIPSNSTDPRRHSNIPGPSRGVNIPGAGMGQIGAFGPPGGGFGAPGSSWNTPAMPFGSSPGLAQPNWSNLPPPGSSWGNNNSAFAANGAFGMAPPMHRPGAGSINRPLTIRIAICQACKQLSTSSRGEGDGFHNVETVLLQIERNRPPLDAPPALPEIEAICETEGDSQNGGGELFIRHNDDGSSSVKWQLDADTPDQARGQTGLGEIGSPMPSKTSPATGFGGSRASATFSSFGAIGTANS